ncbi:MAG: SLC13 family permease [Deltaproteobacteria bacterium]|nr:SLC13 family permease [Deltaproteobacteria bacterium]
MTGNQLTVFVILSATLVLFVWNRWRYDLVALAALMLVFFTGLVRADQLFLGFGHPAVVTVAAVLVISRGLLNAGVINALSRQLAKVGTRPMAQVAALTAIVTVSSGFMNNVGALALMMPVAVWMSRQSGRSPSLLLMPLAFGSLIGGLITLIGTPPNIIIALSREQTGKAAFGMFDFTPVGACVALAGLLFISLIGWRLTPRREGQNSSEELFEIDSYISEVRIPRNSSFVGQTIFHLTSAMEQGKDVIVGALIRGDRQVPVPSLYEVLQEGDLLVVEADTEELQFMIEEMGLELAQAQDKKEKVDRKDVMESDDIRIIEAIVSSGSPMIGKTAVSLRLRRNYGMNLLAVARQGQRIKKRLGDIRFTLGDILLLQGSQESLQTALVSLGCLPLAERGFRLPKPRQILMAVAIFGSAMAAAAFNVAPVQVAFSAAAMVMVLVGLVSVKEIYESIDWSIIVLLGAMFPLGKALESTGGAQLIADKMLLLSSHFPPAATLGMLMVGTMLLSNVVNNAAAAVLMAPIAINLASGMIVSSDPLLMGVAIGASCAFLTPVGHQSNALVMAPGGYQFGDYWHLGLPLSLLVIAVAMPLILFFWPL